MFFENFVEIKNLEPKAKADDCIIPNNDEEFEAAFNIVFRKNELVEDPDQEQDGEIENTYYIQNISTKKEDSAQIYQLDNDIKDKESKEGNINEKKVDYIGEKEIINIEIEVKEDKEDEVKELKTNKDQKIEPNNIDNEGKKNIFRTYNSQEYILFHPGGMDKYFNYIKEEIKKDILNPKKMKDKFAENKFKFNIYKNNKKQKNRKINEKKIRKDKPDNIRKKIKSRFLKILKTKINEKLKNAKSELFFDNLPQCFISNISKNGNKFILDMTIKELLNKNFFEDDTSKDNSKKTFIDKKRNNSKKKSIDKKRNNSKKKSNDKTGNPNKVKHEKNQKVLEYLERESVIRKSSNFDVISGLKFREVFKEYLKSEEFEKDILELNNKNNSEKYIKDYVNKAYDFLDYFSKEN